MAKRSHVSFAAHLSAAIALSLSANALAQDAVAPAMPKDLSTVIVTGTRSDSRTESSSLRPIDVVSAKVLRQTGSNDPPTALARVKPWFGYNGAYVYGKVRYSW